MIPPPVVRVDARDFAAVADLLAKAGTESTRALNASINRVGNTAFTKVRRQLAKNMGIPVGRLTEGSRGLYVQRSNFRNLRYEIDARSQYTPLSYFNPQQRRTGVQAHPWGERRIFPGTFVVTLRSGHVGVFKRTGQRTSTGRPQIKELWGPSLARELVREDTQADSVPQIFRTTFATELPRVLSHEVDRVLGQLNERPRVRRAA